MSAVHLSPESVEAVALRVVELMSEGDQPRGDSLTAAEVADRLGTTREFVYRNRARLGGAKLSDGPKARLRFPVEKVEAFLLGEENAPQPHPPKRSRSRRSPRGANLLPVKGERR